MNITPPMGSDGYLHNSNCLWIIDAPKGKLVQLKFVAFSLESDDQCTFDSVTVYDGYVVSAGSNDTPMGKFCGRSTPPIITTASNALTLVFRTDDSISGIGFTATYEFINASSSEFSIAIFANSKDTNVNSLSFNRMDQFVVEIYSRHREQSNRQAIQAIMATI